MSREWPGGVIRKTPVTPTGPYQDGTAPGVWTLDQMNYWLKQNLWPIAGSGATPRGLFGGGSTGTSINVIQYITITTTGNAVDFGDLTEVKNALASCASSTRGVFGGGNPSNSNVIDYVTISTIGNATDFGDLTVGRNSLAGSSNSTRGLFYGGVGATFSNVIDYITIASTGNATDFGDLLSATDLLAACSNSHGGL